MMTFIIIIHVIVCLALICLVLIQRGRGGGLVESFAGVESMFGTKTSAFLTRATTVLSVMFFCTCLILAVLSVRQSRSLIRSLPKAKPVTSVPAETTNQQAAGAVQQEKTQAAQTQQTEKKENAPKEGKTQEAPKTE